MKHIKFEDSIVMKELAKIAHKEGLVKVAAPNPLAVEMNRLNSMLANIRSKVGSDGEDVPIFTKEVQKSVWKLQKQYGKHPAIDQFYQQAMKLMQHNVALSEVTASVKTADEKLYDVSGETGEQLVDKAHPGGGTKTELTHSKTDENLVETIVEQQEKDIGVAKSVPKGTYASLMDLYSDLKKMGHENKLSGLKKAINIVATENSILNYKLSKLADKLDLMGHKTAANEIDKLIIRLAIDLDKDTRNELSGYKSPPLVNTGPVRMHSPSSEDEPNEDRGGHFQPNLGEDDFDRLDHEGAQDYMDRFDMQNPAPGHDLDPSVESESMGGVERYNESVKEKENLLKSFMADVGISMEEAITLLGK